MDVGQFNLEHIFAEVKTDNNPVYVGSCYRPVNTNAGDFLLEYNKLLKTLSCSVKSKNANLIIGLDHNLDLMKSDLHKPTCDFLQCNYEFGILPAINRPTRVTLSTATLIDNIFISQELIHSMDSVILIDDINNHFPCIVSIAGVKKSFSPTVTYRRKITNKVVDSIQEDLIKLNWHEKLQQLNINNAFELFHETFTDSLDRHAPDRSYNNVKKRNHLPCVRCVVSNPQTLGLFSTYFNF